MSRRRTSIRQAVVTSLPPSIPSLDLSCLQRNESSSSPPQLNREGNRYHQETSVPKNIRNEFRNIDEMQDRRYENRDKRESSRRPPRDLQPIRGGNIKAHLDMRNDIDDLVERHQRHSNKLPSLSRSDGARLHENDSMSTSALERRPDRRLAELPVVSRGTLQPLQNSFRNPPPRAVSTRLW
jgi:hypothetical protein